MLSIIYQAIQLLVLAVAAWVLVMWDGPKREKFRPSVPSKFVRAYEIPNPHSDVLLIHLLIVLIPTSLFALAHHVVFAALSFVVGVVLFHVRNVAVRAENEEGLHDPRWGKHIRRQRQAAQDRALPKALRWLPKLRDVMFPE
ncbi:TPA: hypothetical protein ACYLN4_000637 [Burkholderia lata]